MFRKIKWAYQRATRGWSDSDSWDIRGYFESVVPPMLRKIAEDHAGCPGELYDSAMVNDECWRWKIILEEIAQGFEAAGQMDRLAHKWEKTESGGYQMKYDEELNKELTKKMDRGLELFSKFYLNLWD
jgi:hypothetical protein